MDALQMFFYATVGAASLIFVIDRLKMSVKDALSRLARRKARALSKRFREAFESVQPTVELWWEEHGRKQMRHDGNSLLDIMPEQLMVFAEAQHSGALKQAAMQLAGGIVLKSGTKLGSMERTAVDHEIEELRQQLLDHGIDTDAFEKLFV